MNFFDSALPNCGDIVSFNEISTGTVEQCDSQGCLISIRIPLTDNVRFVRIEYESINSVQRIPKEIK